MNTLENNKLIAEFIEWDINIPSTFPTHLHQEEETQGNWELLFHSDWNWLMEVVEKIEGLGIHGITIYRKSTNINGLPLEISNNRQNTKIEAVYNACVEFIKWYNQNK